MEERQPLLNNKETSFVSSNGLTKSYGTSGPADNDGTSQAFTASPTRQMTPPVNPTPLANAVTDPRKPSLDIVGLSYYVKERTGHWWNGSCFKPARRKVVLNNLCMSFNSGELTGLLGSSGSGKTSLLDVISGRAEGEVSGVVSYKHEQCSRQVMQQTASYVLQADRLLPTLTARETLTFMAYLTLPGRYKSRDIENKVNSALTVMGLTRVAETRIGGSVLRGVSGGEKRRITIAIQLLKDPEIVLLDEPTTGLDAFTARNLVSSMAQLAHTGKMVIMSVHQPRSDIFALLDRMALLTIGQVAYFGRPKDLVPYFTSIGFPCPKNENPCDIYVDVVSVDRRTPSRERTTVQRAKSICDEYSNSNMLADVVKNIAKGLNYHFDESLEPEVVDSPSWFRTFQTLLIRMNVHLVRDSTAVMTRVLETAACVPFILIFLGALKNNQGSIQDRFGIAYQALNVPPFMGMTSAIGLFPVLQNMMYRETHDGLYSKITFLIAYYVHVVPFHVAAVLIYSPLLYWTVGMNSELYAFGSFVLVSFILELFGEIMAVAMLALLHHPQVAYNTTVLIFSMASLVASGLLRPIENMPVFFQWTGYIAITKYATEIIVGNEFNGLELTCTDANGTQCLRSGDDVLDMYYPDALKDMNRNFAIMGGYTFAILIFAWMMFKLRRPPTLY